VTEYKQGAEGIFISGRFFKLQLGLVLMDVPAHSFICATLSHNGYHPCTKCEVFGEHTGRVMSFPHIDETRIKYHEKRRKLSMKLKKT
jgi:hypothetical protein